MPISISDFWSLAVESQLISGDEAGKLSQKFAAKKNGAATVDDLARWLVGTKLTPYQAKILLAGRPGPFVYGDYVIYERIESGRMAGIFRALHRSTGHRVCLFFLSGADVQDPAVMARLHQKVAATNRCSVGHPHLMRCYHLVDSGAYKFIVLEDIEGKRVERVLATGGAMSPSEACRIVRQAALGLGRMHGMHQVHDEIRPAHIWVEPNQNVKLLNFPLVGDPLAPSIPLAKQVDQPGKMPAEADYVAPELISGDAAPDARSDIYSLGCTLYHMLASQPPFAGGDLRSKLKRHAEEKPKPLADLNLNIPAGLSKVVQYMLAKDPELRYQQVNSVVEAILPFISPQDAQTKPDPPTAREQQYEQWLSRYLAANPPPGSSDAAEEPIVAEEAAASPYAPVSAPAPIAQAVMAQPVASPAAMPQAPMAAAIPTAAMAQPAMAQPAMAAPYAPQPVMAAPVGALPQTYPQAAGSFGPAGSMPAVGPVIGELPGGSSMGAPSGAVSRIRRRRSNTTPIILGVVLLVGGFAALYFSGALNKLLGRGPAVASNEPAKGAAPAPSGAAKTATDSAKTSPNKTDTGKTATPGTETPETSTPPPDAREKIFALKDPVWESPTKGAPIDAKFLAPGAQAIIAVRLAELTKHPEGEKLLDPAVSGAIGTWFRDDLPKVVGLPADKLEQVVISLLDGGTAPPVPAYLVRTTEPVASEAMAAVWGNPPLDESFAGKLVYKKDQSLYYLPESGQKRVIVIGPADVMKDVIETDGAAMALPLEVEVLLKQTDSARTLSVLFVPRVMLAAGKPVFTGPGKLWREPLESFLLAGDGTSDLPKAVSASLHLGNDLFMELRLYDGTTGPQNDAPAAVIESRLKQLPKQMRTYFLDHPPSKYSLPIVSNFEDMLRQLVAYSRFGVAEKQVVARAYLPAVAGHNLAMSAYLATIDHPDSGFVSGGAAAGGPPTSVAGAVPAGAAGKLQKKTSLVFERNNLEVTIALLSEDIGVPMVIRGGELQIEGITKNQSFALAEENKPAVEILKTILLKANPADKLVYVIVKNDEGEEVIYITTRVAAAANKWTIPADMQKPADTKKPANTKSTRISVLPAASTGIAEKIKKITTLTFPNNTLEFAVHALAEDIEVPIKLHLESMKIDGITQNQPLKLEQENKPAIDILKAIMLQASPPSDGYPLGKLVYVIAKDVDGSDMIWVCTRPGAEANKWTIPADMQKPADTKKK